MQKECYILNQTNIFLFNSRSNNEEEEETTLKIIIGAGSQINMASVKIYNKNNVLLHTISNSPTISDLIYEEDIIISCGELLPSTLIAEKGRTLTFENIILIFSSNVKKLEINGTLILSNTVSAITIYRNIVINGNGNIRSDCQMMVNIYIQI